MIEPRGKISRPLFGLLLAILCIKAVFLVADSRPSYTSISRTGCNACTASPIRRITNYPQWRSGTCLRARGTGSFFARFPAGRCCWLFFLRVVQIIGLH